MLTIKLYTQIYQLLDSQVYAQADDTTCERLA